jgi:hypothetical protein
MHRKVKDIKLANYQIYTEADYIFDILIVRFHACGGLLVMHLNALGEIPSPEEWMCECSPSGDSSNENIATVRRYGDTDVSIIIIAFPFPFPAL